MDYSKKYTYSMLEEDLEIGHEIEFYYNHKKYSFSHNNGEWYLTEFNNPDFQTYSNYRELLNSGIIDGYHIKDIWEEVQIDAFF